MNYIQPNKKIEKGIWIFTIVVFALVLALHEIQKAQLSLPFTKILPQVNATINGTCFILLILSLIAVKQRNFPYTCASTLWQCFFLWCFYCLMFCIMHSTAILLMAEKAKDCTISFLFSHIILAAVSLPMILFSYYHGLCNQTQKHKKLVRFTYPIWLYVTLTGVLVYLFLAPYYS